MGSGAKERERARVRRTVNRDGSEKRVCAEPRATSHVALQPGNSQYQYFWKKFFSTGGASAPAVPSAFGLGGGRRDGLARVVTGVTGRKVMIVWQRRD